MAKHPNAELIVYDYTNGFVVSVISLTGKCPHPDDGFKAAARTIKRLANDPQKVWDNV